MSVFIRLTSSEMSMTFALARKRGQNKRDNGVQSKIKSTSRDDETIDRVGMRAEVAVANYLGVSPDWKLLAGSDGGQDLRLPDGRTVQVKCRDPIGSGPDFALMSDDPADFNTDLGVLVYETRNDDWFEIIGTITRARFLELAKPVPFGALGRRAIVTPEQMDPVS
jgi:hypothetical protein